MDRERGGRLWQSGGAMIPGEIEGIVVRFGELSVGGRRLARWSAVAAVATLTMSQLQPSAMPVRGLFDSLGAELRDSTLCAARTPRWLWVSAHSWDWS